jgi:dipeptidyl aminopeptidase/acylaminoacyl peptidase
MRFELSPKVINSRRRIAAKNEFIPRFWRGLPMNRATLLAVLLLLAVGANPQAPTPAPQRTADLRRLTMEDVLRWRIPAQPALSPDGRRVAFVVSENDFEQSRTVTHLWWVDIESRQARRLTHTDAGAAAPRWSPDGRWLAFLSARRENSTKPVRQVWLLPSDGGEAQPLTRAPEGVLHFAWSPDSKSVFYVAPEPPPRPLAALTEEQKKRGMDAKIVDDERPRRGIWRMALDERRAERLYAGDPGVEQITPSPDGKWVIFETNSTGDPDHARKIDLWLLDVAARRAKQLINRDGRERAVVWSPDSSRVAFLAPRDPGIVFAQEEVFVMPLPAASVTSQPQRLTKDFSGNIEQLYWPAPGDAIYFAAAVRTGNQLFRLSVADGTARPASAENLFLTEANWSADGSACIALLHAPDTLPEIVLLRPAASLVEPQRLTQLNPQLKSFALGEQQVIQWKSSDGKLIEGVLVKPAGWLPGSKTPLLLQIHGGPYSRRANTLLDSASAQVWAARGWLVLAPNFRGSSAYGYEFGIASRGDIGGKDFDDILSGVDFLIAQGWADEQRMAVMGGSYGGFMTNHIIGRTKRFKAAVSLFGIFSLVTDYSNSELPSWELNYLGQTWWEAPQLYAERSPAKNVANITTPVLILHGEEDSNTFISNSQELYQALRALGRTVKFVRFPREGHGFREPNHRLEEFRLMAAWFDEHALGRGQAGARVVSERVRQGDWELRVGEVRLPESYAGVRARGRFLEVEIIVRLISPGLQSMSLLIFDTAGSEVTLAVTQPVPMAGRSVFPVGVVAETLGQRILLKSSAQVAAMQADREGQHAALAVTVVFDLPAGAREVALTVKEFPPLLIQLPAE